MKAQEMLLCTHFEATATVENASCPKSGMTTVRPKSTTSPVIASTTKEPAISQ